MPAAVELLGVGKRYRKYEDNPLLLTAALRLRRGTRRSETWAVRGIDLEVPAGECFGVIGRNGSGKSTLLQLLAGVSAPTEGVVRMGGRVAPLLSVGVGFSPELTGRENIHLNGTILGLAAADIAAAMDDIIAFADIGPFVDTPVKFYSSGMTVRLGFAVAAQARPDILLLDEVLAVGDIAFQMKCFDRMADIVESGATVLLVSHNMSAIRRLCTRTLVLHAGRPRYLGPTEEGVQSYLDAILEAPAPGAEGDGEPLAAGLPNVARITDVDVVPGDGGVLRVSVSFDGSTDWPGAALAVFVATAAGVPVYHAQSPDLGPITPGAHRWTAELRTALAAGGYSVIVALRSLDPYARIDRAPAVEVRIPGRTGVQGLADLGGRLEVLPS